jgi:hypothetical protein
MLFGLLSLDNGAKIDTIRMVHVEYAYRRPSNGRSARDHRSNHLKMIVPILRPWVKKRDHRIVERVQAGKIRPFVRIAMGTRKSEIRFVVRTAVLLGDHMLDLISIEWFIVLSRVTVFAPVPGTLANPKPGDRVHG